MVTRREASGGLLSVAVLAGTGGLAAAAEATTRTLPPPRTNGSMPLMQALTLRHSTREYTDRPLPTQVLSDLLWTAFGINRPVNRRGVSVPIGDGVPESAP